jgi:4-carboxymuconolactone decarboxylase
MEYPSDVYQQFERAFPHVHSDHQDLAKACYEGGPLDQRTARLVKLGIALGAQAEGAVRSYARRALREGREEVRRVGLLALTTIGFPHTIAGLRWIEEVVRDRELTREGKASARRDRFERSVAVEFAHGLRRFLAEHPATGCPTMHGARPRRRSRQAGETARGPRPPVTPRLVMTIRKRLRCRSRVQAVLRGGAPDARRGPTAGVRWRTAGGAERCDERRPLDAPRPYTRSWGNPR